jgi:anti-sigma B factor antagonist
MLMADISVEAFKRVDLITVNGRIDSSNAFELDDSFKKLADDGRYQLVVELSGVDYMSSAGLRALVAAFRESKKHRGDVRLANPSTRMSEVLDLAGLDSIFSIYEDATAAVGSY